MLIFEILELALWNAVVGTVFNLAQYKWYEEVRLYWNALSDAPLSVKIIEVSRNIHINHWQFLHDVALDIFAPIDDDDDDDGDTQPVH